MSLLQFSCHINFSCHIYLPHCSYYSTLTTSLSSHGITFLWYCFVACWMTVRRQLLLTPYLLARPAPHDVLLIYSTLVHLPPCSLYPFLLYLILLLFSHLYLFFPFVCFIALFYFIFISFTWLWIACFPPFPVKAVSFFYNYLFIFVLAATY